MLASRMGRKAINQASLARAETMRASLPLGMYLGLLHTAAVTGEMPVLSPRGQPTDRREQLTPTERLRLLQYLVDKCMGPVNAALPAPPSTDILRTLTPEQLRGLTLDELRTLMTPSEESQVLAVIDINDADTQEHDDAES